MYDWVGELTQRNDDPDAQVINNISKNSFLTRKKPSTLVTHPG